MSNLTLCIILLIIMIILAEKPNVAKDIALALGRFKFQDGIWISGKDCILSARGHLLISQMPEEYDPKWKSWKDSFKDLPINPPKFIYKENPNTKEVLHQIKKCFKEFDSSEFILATDAEREGEVIGAEILDYVGFQNYAAAKRFWVSEALTPEVVKKGLAQAKPLSEYESYKAAGFARANADWLIGMNFSRLLTVSCGNKAIFSFGRVQTAILGVIYLRDKNIKNFKPADYFQLVCKVNKDNYNFSLYYNKDDSDRFSSRTELEFLKDKLTNQDKLKITKIETIEKKYDNLLFRTPLLYAENKITTEILNTYKTSFLEYIKVHNFNYEIKDNEYFLWKKNNVKEKIKDCQEFPFKAFLEYCAKCSLKDLEIALLPYVAFLKNAGKEKGDYYLYLEEAKNFINDYNERNEK